MHGELDEIALIQTDLAEAISYVHSASSPLCLRTMLKVTEFRQHAPDALSFVLADGFERNGAMLSADAHEIERILDAADPGAL